MAKFITGLDIGSSRIKVLVAKEGEKNLELVWKYERESEGVRRGVVVDGERVSGILKEIFSQASRDLTKKINSVVLGLNGSHLFAIPTKGVISVSRADQKISEEDVQRVLKEAQAINLGTNKEIFDIFPQEFVIDGEGKIKEAVGLKGIKLEVKALALAGFSPYFENLKKAVLDANLEILDLVFHPLAAARSCLDERQKELGVCLTDFGAGTTSLAVFLEGDLVHLAVLPVGSSNITNDLAIGLKIEPEIAERIKLEYGVAFRKGKDEKYKLEIDGEEPLILSQKILTRIIEPRLTEIFNEVTKELKKIGLEKRLPAGIVLTGGGAKMPRLLELAKKKFSLNCRLGRPKGISGIEDDPSLAVVAGLVLAGTDFGEEISKIGFASKIKRFFKIFLP